MADSESVVTGFGGGGSSSTIEVEEGEEEEEEKARKDFDGYLLGVNGEQNHELLQERQQIGD